ncbi:hypothetical protein CLV47_10181 [Antricoccus suffuscus]|uniref:Uncharacterized protein n=1 Tax=Antricoccus suffuscus TaxID=1629062 RepID=A0A2T1A655_9ACTN|nr:hypothetical protein [Antricoccus suffuscus]PRZ43957.1 hypothetical protein CLV47_10181 [Antricoccus suffuscus]
MATRRTSPQQQTTTRTRKERVAVTAMTILSHDQRTRNRAQHAAQYRDQVAQNATHTDGGTF